MNTTTHMITGPDGRQLFVLEAGKPHGVPVLVHLGTPGAGLLYAPWVEDASRRGIRLITYDRPGYGASSPHPGRDVASAAADVAEIARHLGITRLLVWGLSGGGPHSLACAALLPDLVVAAACLAGPAPHSADGLDWMRGMGADNVTEFGAALESRQAVAKFIADATPGLLAATPGTLVAEMKSLLSPPDVAALDESLAGFLIQTMVRGLERRQDGWIDDDLAFTSAWGFDPADIRVPVLIMQGQQDRMVPFTHGAWLARRIPSAEARLLPDDGHLTLIAKHIPEVHAWLLRQLP